jgi:hypothetical protein
MSEMIERVARAIARAEKWDNISDKTLSVYIPLALAAIVAIPEYQEALWLLENVAGSLWQMGAEAKAGDIYRFLDRAMPTTEISAALQPATDTGEAK